MMSSVYHFCLSALFSLALITFFTVTPSQAKECLDCHAEILRQLQGSSHHIQGVEPNSRHCYACHWEATADGEIDRRYHGGSENRVDLVVWQDGARPAEHLSGRTAIAFRPSASGSEQERKEIAGITLHCLSCHNDATSRTKVFSGDPNMPGSYAWDRESIASRYTNRNTTTWGKYSTANTNKKQRVVKALSPHGNAAANQGGWRAAVGYDGDMPLSRGGSSSGNVECFDCHNSHGSQLQGVTSSYPVPGKGNSGGILKQTVAGSSGYRVSYQPSANTYANSSNPFNPGAGLCFDCHETASAGATPWGYNSTFGLLQPVMGYKDTPGFGQGVKGSSGRFPNRQGRDDIVSSHLKSGVPLHGSPREQINGLCTPCHDPHGVSRALGENMAYAVPLLKGSWLTSPYREDGPPAGLPGRTGSGIPNRESFNSVNRDAGSNFAREGSGPPRKGDYNSVNRSAGSNFTKEGSSTPREDYNSVNRSAGSNFAKESSSAPRDDYNSVNRDAGSNFAREGSSPPRESDYNSVNRSSGSNFTREGSSAPREDYNSVNRSAGSNFAKESSSAPRDDYNSVNREAGSNFAREGSSPPREGDYNSVNLSAGSNFTREGSSAPRGDYNSINRSAGSNFAKESSSAPRDDYNSVNREAGSNFAREGSTAARSDEFNTVNRDAGSNFARQTGGASREMDANRANRDANSNFAKSGMGSPREPMQGMKYNVDRNTFEGEKRISENDSRFAGLCLKCHSRENLTAQNEAGMIHRTVKGWGSNKEHSFPCSKCHQAHNSGLPRLMQTNCFEQGPSGLRESSGISWLPYKQDEPAKGTRPAKKSSSPQNNKIVGCHVKQFGKAMSNGQKGNDNGAWKEVTSW